jgi:hypothetical protein
MKKKFIHIDMNMISRNLIKKQNEHDPLPESWDKVTIS